jgi:hypothetical protein
MWFRIPITAANWVIVQSLEKPREHATLKMAFCRERERSGNRRLF